MSSSTKSEADAAREEATFYAALTETLAFTCWGKVTDRQEARAPNGLTNASAVCAARL